MDEVLDQLVDEVLARTGGPVAVYGHCLGGAHARPRWRCGWRRAASRSPAWSWAASLPATRLPGRLEPRRRAVRPHRPVDVGPHRTARCCGVMGGLDDPDGATPATPPATRRCCVRCGTTPARPRSCSPRALEDGSPTLAAPLLVVMGERDRTTELYEERYAEWAAFADHVELATVAARRALLPQAPGPTSSPTRCAAPSAGGAGGAASAGPRPAPRPPRPARVRRGRGRPDAVAGGHGPVRLRARACSCLQETGRVGLYALVTMLALLPAIFLAPLGRRAGRPGRPARADAARRRRGAGRRRWCWRRCGGPAGSSSGTCTPPVAVGSAATAFHRPGVAGGGQPAGAQAVPGAGQRRGAARHRARHAARPARRRRAAGRDRAAAACWGSTPSRSSLRRRGAARRPVPRPDVQAAGGDLPTRPHRRLAVRRPASADGRDDGVLRRHEPAPRRAAGARGTGGAVDRHRRAARPRHRCRRARRGGRRR